MSIFLFISSSVNVHCAGCSSVTDRMIFHSTDVTLNSDNRDDDVTVENHDELYAVKAIFRICAWAIQRLASSTDNTGPIVIEVIVSRHDKPACYSAAII